ncbi:hypothetical protein AOLI_G00297660 [Acnodon oligacanthus]
MLIAAKEERLVRELAEFRVRAPELPMVRELDLGVTVTSSCSVEPDEGEESHCSNPEPATQADSSEPESSEAEASPAAPEVARGPAEPELHYHISQKHDAECQHVRGPHQDLLTPEMSGLSNAQFKRILLQFKKLQKDISRKASQNRRSSGRSPAKNHLPAEERELLCKGMCHNISTADRFYTVVPEIQNVFRVWDLCMKAMEQEGMGLGSHHSDTEDPEPYLDADTDTDT